MLKRVLRRTHVHAGAACIVCNTEPIAVKALPPVSLGLPVSAEASTAGSSSSLLYSAPPSEAVGTVEEWRELALREWLRHHDVMRPRSSSRHVSASADPLSADEALWRRFESATEPLSSEAYDQLTAYLTSFTSLGLDEEFCRSQERRIRDEMLKAEGSSCVASNASSSSGVAPSVTATTIELPPGDCKQDAFFAALHDFMTRVVCNTELRRHVFACCGTALGLHREKHFIPHDTDIDLGVAVEALQPDRSTAVLELLSNAAMSGAFVCIDVCGEVDKGLELRFQHTATGTLVDLNVYYPPLDSDLSVSQSRSDKDAFVWCATHYEQSAARKHGMYRYRHRPFYHSLTPVVVMRPSDKASVQVLLPPTTYLDEYFGADWRTPKRYSYREGLASEYRNIIAE